MVFQVCTRQHSKCSIYEQDVQKVTWNGLWCRRLQLIFSNYENIYAVLCNFCTFLQRPSVLMQCSTSPADRWLLLRCYWCQRLDSGKMGLGGIFSFIHLFFYYSFFYFIILQTHSNTDQKDNLKPFNVLSTKKGPNGFLFFEYNWTFDRRGSAEHTRAPLRFNHTEIHSVMFSNPTMIHF